LDQEKTFLLQLPPNFTNQTNASSATPQNLLTPQNPDHITLPISKTLNIPS